MTKFLLKCIEGHCNIIVAGETGSGKTELSLRATTENDNVVIVGLSKQAISVYLDYQDSKSFSVMPNARNESFNLPQGYSYGDFKVTTASKITVKGPATEIDKITGIEAVFDIDEKTVETKKQHNLSATERMTNLDNTFRLKSGADVRGKTVILCDDIKTTGTTLKKCCDVLFENGARDVYCLCIAVSDYQQDMNF